MTAGALAVVGRRDRDGLGLRALGAFLGLTYLLSWGDMAAYLFIPGVAGFVGEVSNSHPLFVLAVYAPAISAIVLVLADGGHAGLGRFLSRLGLWRAPAGWWAFLILGVPAIYVAGAALGNGLDEWRLPKGLLGAMLFMLVLGPVEEFGWRGFMLPLLQRRMAPLWAGLLVGVVWGVWHLPAFYLGGTVQSEWAFLPFFLGSVALSVIFTALFNDARGSLLLPALLHLQVNNPLWPDAQPWDMALFGFAAALVVWLRRERMLSREGGATGVMDNRGERTA
ncbi:CPBP family intramembrane glutamic endopeptidase [Rubellimicrobium roseum]|uniref:CPBP family intramembrane metalloprotease n=1 Tax=Rubellimicrobium roseum TaxID=687525 RepID=A0A5C4N9A4_9RHOB|nr:CPBP family intramembrane glutamic endopeptidase [Rubellimicrobium roseum]TNC62554.1 CPBP family intramembrane metalloprotease [Rubellimicrobium roseum]